MHQINTSYGQGLGGSRSAGIDLAASVRYAVDAVTSPVDYPFRPIQTVEIKMPGTRTSCVFIRVRK